jgi:multiple sugar transport system substrate-binding protein
VLPQPVNPNAKKNSFVWGYSGGYSIASNSKKPDAAWTFIKWLSSPAINLEYSKGFGCLPLYKSGLKDAFYQNGVMKGYADALLDPKIQYLRQPNELSQWGYFLAEYYKTEVQKYMAGQQTAEQTLANISQWMSAQYDKDIAGK